MRDNTKAFGQAVDNPFGRTARDIIEEHVVGSGMPCGMERAGRTWHAQRALGAWLSVALKVRQGKG